MATLVYAVDKPELPPFTMPDRFRHDITYFVTHPGDKGVPLLPVGEYWVLPEDARRILDDGCLRIVSPLDSDNTTEIEITEEQEDWLAWMVEHSVVHVRLR
jgi:hypothetical protein